MSDIFSDLKKLEEMKAVLAKDFGCIKGRDEPEAVSLKAQIATAFSQAAQSYYQLKESRAYMFALTERQRNLKP